MAMTLAFALILIGFTGWAQWGNVNASVVVCPDIPNSTTGDLPANPSCYCVDITRKRIGTVLEVLGQDHTVLSRLFSNI